MMRLLLESIRVPKVDLPEERPTDRQDFNEHRPVSLESLRKVDVEQVAEEDLPLLILICTEHTSITEDNGPLDWSTEAHELEVRKLVDQIVLRLEMKSFSQVLETYTKEIFGFLQPSLESWPSYPAACHSACVLFYNLEGDLAGEHLGKIFPYMLRWLDSWMTIPRIQGANLVNRILTSIPSTWLTKFGRDKVLYDALLHLLNAQEVHVLAAVGQPLPVLLELVSRGKRDDPTRVNDVDKFVNTIMASLDMESNMAKKLIKTNLLKKSWDLLGRGVLRWISRLAHLLECDSDVVGEHSIILLKLWETVCEEYPTAAAREQRIILRALVKLAWRWSHGSSLYAGVTEELLLRVLEKQIGTDPAAFLKYTKGIQDVKTNPKFSKMMTSLLESCGDVNVSAVAQ